MAKQIEFNLGAEKQIRIAEAGHRDALFYEGYRQGLAGIIEIVRASTAYTKSEDCVCRHTGQNRPPYEDKEYYNYPNNLIVFTGGRGTGKSSAMLTFVNSLTNPASELFRKNILREVVTRELPGLIDKSDPERTVDVIEDLMKQTRFIPIPPIDPTTLEADGQILINILARMFQTAETFWEENKCSQGNRIELNEKNKLMQQFTVCYECINALKNKKDDNQALDPLDLLANLGGGSNLKQQIAQLVKDLLEFVNRDFREDTYLVLQIDDTDMNIRHAYDILEDIRKYLVIPRLIIVMAADLEHLSQVVESSLADSYSKSVSGEEFCVCDIAAQYINKLVPQSRRICLPDLEVYLKEHPDTRIKYSAPFEEKILPDGSHFLNSQDQIFRLIYRKTGMIFLQQEHQLHYIIPGNMRLLGHFLTMLVQMKDVANPDDGNILSGAGFFLSERTEEKRKEHLETLQVRLQNIQRFRDYFLDVWVDNALSREDAKRLRELVGANLPNKVTIVCGLQMDTLRRAGYVDMIRILREKEREMETEEDSRYIYAVHTLFSLLGHTIVLEELITHYSSPDWAATDCVFTRLYPLFGSRPFSYLKGEMFRRLTLREYLSWTPLADTEDMEDTFVPTGEELTTILFTNPNSRRCWLPIRWEAPVRMRMPAALQHTRTNPRFLYTMFCPYDLPEGTSEIWADLAAPIANCLYISPSEYSSPLSRVAVPSPSHTSAMKADEWTGVQSSSLLVMLNWDVRRMLGDSLINKVLVTQELYGEDLARIPTIRKKESSSKFIPCVAAFYKCLTVPFQRDAAPESTEALTDTELAEYMGDRDAQDKVSVKPGLAIACLEDLNLDQWISWLDESQLLPKADDENQTEENIRRPINDARKIWLDTLQEFYPFG